MASVQELYNLSNFLFDSEASGVNATSPPYKPEDIIIVSTSKNFRFKLLTLCSLPMVSALRPVLSSWN